MAPRQSEGMRVAIVVADDFEQSELTTPKQAPEEAGAQALIVSSASSFRIFRVVEPQKPHDHRRSLAFNRARRSQ